MADPRGGPVFPASSLHKGPFCRGQLMVSSCPVVRPLLQQQVPSPTLHLAPVCDLSPGPNLHCSLIFSPSVPPAWEPTLGQLHFAPVSFLPLTWAHRLDCQLCLLPFSIHLTCMLSSFPLALPEQTDITTNWLHRKRTLSLQTVMMHIS